MDTRSSDVRPELEALIPSRNRRILIIDDTPAIHQDIRKILALPSRRLNELEADENALFGDAPAPNRSDDAYEIDSAMQGQEGYEMVARAVRMSKPYALVFTDMRMPPGWDGVDTIERILKVDPSAQVCICSAYSDYSWHEVIRRVGRPGLRLLRKPFETHEVLATAAELTEKWARAKAESLRAKAPGGR
jgi:DNA-binding NtrC family response regulator